MKTVFLKFFEPVDPGVERMLTEYFTEFRWGYSVAEEIVINDDVYIVWDDTIELVHPNDFTQNKIVATLSGEAFDA